MNISGITGQNYPLASALQGTEKTDEKARVEDAFARQEVATNGNSNAAQAATDNSTAEKEREENLLNQLFEQLLARKLGIDKEKLDELKEKMEELTAKKEAINEDGSLDPAQKKQAISSINKEITSLQNEIEALIAEAAERQNEEEMKQQQTDQLLGHYRDTASFLWG